MPQSKPEKQYTYSARVYVTRTEVPRPEEPPAYLLSVHSEAPPKKVEPEPVEIGNFEAFAGELLDLHDKVVGHMDAIALDDRKRVSQLRGELTVTQAKVAETQGEIDEIKKRLAAERRAKEALQNIINEERKAVNAKKAPENGQVNAAQPTD